MDGREGAKLRAVVTGKGYICKGDGRVEYISTPDGVGRLTYSRVEGGWCCAGRGPFSHLAGRNEDPSMAVVDYLERASGYRRRLLHELGELEEAVKAAEMLRRAIVEVSE